MREGLGTATLGGVAVPLSESPRAAGGPAYLERVLTFTSLRDHRTHLGAVLASTLVLLLLAVLPALAHGGIVPQPVVERVPSGISGLEAEGIVAFSPRIRVTNTSDDVFTVADDSGRAWLQISSAGVLADLTVRRWYESLDASGRGIDPPTDAAAGWTQIAASPTWEWFDTDLLPRVTADDDHGWTIPVVVDGVFDQIEGDLVESDLQGRWGTTLTSSPDIGAARLTAVSGPVPVFVIQRLAAEEIIVLGRQDEPMIRLTAAGFEVNAASPTWGEHARLDPGETVGVVVTDADADPVWMMKLDAAPTATWLDTRGSNGQVVPRSRGDATIGFVVPIMVDGVRHDVDVVTAWVGTQPPLLGLRLTVPGLVGLSLGAGLVAAGLVRRWERRRVGTDADLDADARVDAESE
ncbi:MAG: hypothetical protein ACI970_001064 [Myxococcota bacterium]